MTDPPSPRSPDTLLGRASALDGAGQAQPVTSSAVAQAARLRTRAGQGARALASLRAAVPAAATASHPPEDLLPLHAAEVVVHLALGDRHAAAALLAITLPRVRSTRPELLPTCLIDAGLVALANDQPDQAATCLEQALVALGPGASTTEGRRARLAQGLMLHLHGAWRRAMSVGRQLAQEARSDADVADEADAWTLIGRILVDERSYAPARRAHETALTLHRQVGAAPGMVASLGGLGLCALGEGGGATARGAQLLQQAITLAMTARDPGAEAAWRAHLDHALVLLGRYEQRIVALNAFLDLVRRTPDPTREAGLLTALGHSWREINDPERARACYAEAIHRDPERADEAREALLAMPQERRGAMG